MATESYSIDLNRGAIFDKGSFSLKVVRDANGLIEIQDRNEQEIRDAAYAFYGRTALGIERRDGIFNRPSLEDWEMLEAEHPEIHDRLDKTVRHMLERSGIEPPFTPELAQVHSLEEILARRDTAPQIEPEAQIINIHSAVS